METNLLFTLCLNNKPIIYSKRIMFKKEIVSRMSSRLLLFVLLSCSVGFTQTVYGGYKHLKQTNRYYIDALRGNDKNNGHSPAMAWKSLTAINQHVFQPGDQVLLKCGEMWTGQLHPKGSGSQGSPIRLSNYGTGKKPVINGAGSDNGALYFYNQSYWNIQNLNITNYNKQEEKGLSILAWENKNRTDFVKPELPAQFNNHNKSKFGIFISAQDTGEVKHIHFTGVEVHAVNGYINQADEESKSNGGINFNISGTAKPTWFNDILIDSCYIHDVDRTGLFFNSTWSTRSLTTNTNWKGSLDVHILHSKFECTGANALVVRVSQRPVIEKNLFEYCAIKGSGNAAFSFNCDSATWQYNECRFTKANIDDRDAGGIDADYKATNTIIQYNYIHDNDYGLLITGGPDSYNDNTVLRYNIIENDGKYTHPTHGKDIIRVSGSATNTHIYNNTIYIGPDQTDTKIISHETWKTSPVHTDYENNIFYNLSKDALYDTGKSADNSFTNNLFFGNPAKDKPADQHAINSDPLFLNPGKKSPAGYRLKKGSLAIAAGKPVNDNGGYDYERHPLSAKPAVGAINGSSK